MRTTLSICAHRGAKRVYVAVAHSMFIAVYLFLKEGAVFKDPGAEYYSQFNKVVFHSKEWKKTYRI